jgi:hypothetical protein
MAKSLALPNSVRGALNYIRSKAPALARARVKAEQGAGRMKDALLILGGASSAGAACAVIGDPAMRGHIRIGSVPYDLDAVVPALGILGGVADGFGKYSDDAVLYFSGALAPWLKEQVHFRVAAMKSGVPRGSSSSVSGSNVFDPELIG